MFKKEKKEKKDKVIISRCKIEAKDDPKENFPFSSNISDFNKNKLNLFPNIPVLN